MLCAPIPMLVFSEVTFNIGLIVQDEFERVGHDIQAMVNGFCF